jgi:hypothetical protein
MSNDIQRAWEKAQAAWEAAGCAIPCYDEAYMAARTELSEAYARAEAETRKHLRQHAQARLGKK